MSCSSDLGTIQGQRKRGPAPSSELTKSSASLQASNKSSYKARTGGKRKAAESPLEDSAPSKKPARQSKRAKEAATRAGGEDTVACEPDKMDQSNGTRRNPKRKAADDAQAAASTQPPRDDLLREALQPLTKEDIRQWGGWCELESEPAFFDALLSEYGVQNVRIQELITFDDDMIAMLPKPVFGLIFLFQYLDENDVEAEEADDRDVWFANQTTDNACATLAMMNIIMNNSQVQLSPSLQTFKDATQNLTSPLRGRALDTNESIRTIHNSLARRIDLLNGDLWISNKDEAYKKTIRRKAPSKRGDGGKKKPQSKQTKKGTKKAKVASDTAFHYIAYVTVNGSLWELDGLKPRPVDLGVLSYGQDVVSAARPFIEARCAQFGDDAVHFNVMGLCQSPLVAARISLAQSIRHVDLLNNLRKENDHFASLVEELNQPLTADDTDVLLQYGLTPEDVENAVPDADFVAKTTNPDTSSAQLYEMLEELRTTQKSTMGVYRDERATLVMNEQRVEGRKQDSMPMIHRWLEALAGHERLEELMDG